MPYEVVHAKRKELTDVFRRLIQATAGSGVAQAAVAGLYVRVGLAALGRIKSQFVVKARGGTDDCGLKWDVLKKSTIAYSRRHPGVLWPGKKRAPFAPSWMLTDKQRKRWHALNAVGGAAYAWHILKQEGAKTLIGEYGDTPVEILRDSGVLLNSLSPGIPGSVPDQVFRVSPGSVTVGTNRKWAGAHHRGVPGKIPKRPLWPSPDSWTEAWWSDILTQAKQGVLDILVNLLRSN